MGRTMAEKVWDAHVVHRSEGEPDLLYIDLHLIHEVTSPQAFDGLRAAGRPVRRPDLTLATEDHNVPTIAIDQPIADPVSRAQVDAARQLRGVRRAAVSVGFRWSGNRACRGTATGPHPTGYDRGVRRLPHLDSWRVRSSRLRHRNQRGRARPGDPDPAPQAVQDDGGHCRRRAAPGGDRQGRDPQSSPRSAPGADRDT